MNPLDSQLRADVAALATPAGRMVGSLGHAEARRFLCARMAALGLEPYNHSSGYPLPYQQGGREFFNLLGVLPGKDRRLRPILLGAHYDSVIDAPCADDNAAAVAITLAMVERLRATPPARDVIVAFFDAEEPPYFLSQSMGSIRFVLDQMDARGVGFALIQDLTGHEVSVPFLPQTIAGAVLPRLRNLLFVTGAESHPTLPKLVRDCLPADGLSLIATLNENVGDMSDHHIFRTMGVPYLFFSCGRWEHYHQRSDTPEKLSYSKMARIADFLSGVAHRCASQDLPKAGEHDTTEFEVGLLKETLGMFLPVFLPLVGLKKLETRADLDALAARLAGLGL